VEFEKTLVDDFPIVLFEEPIVAKKVTKVQRSSKPPIAPPSPPKELMGDATINKDNAVLFTKTTYETKAEPYQVASTQSWSASSQMSMQTSMQSVEISEEEIRAARLEIERSVEDRVTLTQRPHIPMVQASSDSSQYRGNARAEQQYSTVSQVDYKAPYSGEAVRVRGQEQQYNTVSQVAYKAPYSGEAVRVKGLTVPITPALDRGRKVGLGLNLERNAAGQTIITNIMPGFGAIKSGLIAVQDQVLAIDNVPLDSISLDEAKARTIGSEGSWCNLALCSQTANSKAYQVTVMRTVPRNSGATEGYGEEGNSEGAARAISLTLLSPTFDED